MRPIGELFAFVKYHILRIAALHWPFAGKERLKNTCAAKDTEGLKNGLIQRF